MNDSSCFPLNALDIVFHVVIAINKIGIKDYE